MRDEKKVFQLLGETSASIFPLAQDIMQAQFEKHFSEQRFYQPTFMAYNISPKPISVDLIFKRTPYTNPAEVETTLAATAEAGYLISDGEDGYLVTEKGTAAIDSVHNSFYDHINSVNQFPGDQSSELAALLGKLVEGVRKSVHLHDKICFEISHFGHPEARKGSLAQVDQHLDDLNAFRDDAHIAAWTPVGVSGHTWEVLSFVWNGNANSAEKLAESLPYRNYDLEDYTQVLEDLVQREWIETSKDGFTATKTGKKIREDAETTTDVNYFTPWKILSDDELVQLGNLLGG